MLSLKANRTFSRIACVVFLAFLVPTVSAAEPLCSIQNTPSKELNDYMVNLETVLAGTLSSTTKQCPKENIGDGINKIASDVVGSMNSALGFSNFATAGRFYIDVALRTEIPPAITRDHRKLASELDKIREAIDIVYNRCSNNTIVDKNFIDEKIYQTKGKTTGSILQELLINQVNMMNMYRSVVLGDTLSNSSFLLVGDNASFEASMRKNYGSEGFGKCVREAKVFNNLKESLTTISNLGGGIERGMKNWKDASMLLKNANSQNDAEKRKNVVRIKLGAQGISISFSQATVNNMIKYGSDDPLVSVSGKIKTIGDIISQTVRISDNSYNTRREQVYRSRDTELAKVLRNNIIGIETLNNEIRENYIEAKRQIGSENLSSDQTLASLINTHVTLEDTNRYIQEYIKISEKICNDQSTGDGNCRGFKQ